MDLCQLKGFHTPQPCDMDISLSPLKMGTWRLQGIQHAFPFFQRTCKRRPVFHLAMQGKPSSSLWCVCREHLTSDTCGCQVCRGFPTPTRNSQTPSGVLQFNEILTLSTWRWHQIPQVKASVPHNCHTALQMPVACQGYLSPELLISWL